MRKYIFLFVFLSFSFCVEAVKISGENPNYAGQEITFFKFLDPISKSESALFTLTFDKNGAFETEIEVDKTTFIFGEFGIYKGQILLEPNKNVKILFPPLREKSFADSKNPFFEPLAFWFQTKETSVNNQISEYEIAFNQITDKYFNELYFRQSATTLDSVKFFLSKQFADNNSEWIETWKQLKIQLLETDVFRQKPENISESLTKISSDFWEMPAFLQLFEKLFNKRLSLDSKSSKGKNLQSVVGKEDLGFLLNYLQNQYKLVPPFRDFVCLKVLYDAFYSGEFPKNQIIKMIDSPAFSQNKNSLIQQYAKSISHKIKHLLPGTLAPVICLNTLQEEKRCSNSNTQKFKYLVFADVEMVVCKEHLKYLSKINERFSNHLEIFVIYKNTGGNEIQTFVDENEISGIPMLDNKNKFSKDYQIKTFPTCFLLDEKHQVVFSETKAPLSGFEQQFATFLQHERF